MVVGIGREPRFLGRHVGGGRRRHFQRRPRPADCRMLGLLLGQRIEQRSRFVGLAAGNHRPRKPADHRRIVGVHLPDLAKMILGARRIALASTCSPIAISGSTCGGQVLRLALDRQLGEQLVEDALQLRFGAVAGEVGDRLALEEGVDGRDRLDPELGGDQLVLLDVDLGQHHALVGIVGRDLFEHRAEAACTARTIRPRNRGSPGWSSTAR